MQDVAVRPSGRSATAAGFSAPSTTTPISLRHSNWVAICDKVSTTGNAAVTRSPKDATPERAEHSAHERDIDHRGLVDDQQIAIERLLLVASEAAGSGIGFEQAMDRLRLEPVLSDRRLAAGPVGAQSAISTVFASRILRMELTRVVLPTPGPPVITSTLEARAMRTASRWLSASASFVRCSTQG
jgi:hypothetical protein